MPHHFRRHTAPRQPWSVLAVMAIAEFMVVLDVTVVNVALPSIGADLGFDAGDLQWVVTAYVLLTGGLLLLGGRMADMLGRRRVFLAGLGLFTAASLASGLAGSPALLVAARAAQGAAAALLLPAALSIVTTTYTGPQRTTALAVWGGVGSGGAAAGMLVGGTLTTWLGWEAVFLVNVPVGAATALAALHLVPRGGAPAGQRRRLDVPGAATVVAGLVALVYALAEAPDHGWASARTLGLLALAGALLVAFATIERRSAQPLVAPATWRVRSLVGSAAVMLAATGVLVGAIFTSSLHLQTELGASALETGLAFLPIAIAIGLAAHAAAHLLPRAGSRALVVAGLGLVAIAGLVLAAAPGDASYARDLLPGFVALGAGVGLVFPSVSVTAMTHVGHDDSGLASGVMTTAHEIGAALGVSVLAAVASAAGGFGAGYGDASLVVAGGAAVAAVAAALRFPGVRPAAGAAVPVH